MLRAHPLSPAAGTRVSMRPTLGIAVKHSAVIRLTHWINFPLLTIMIWSGLLIYWAGSSPADHSTEHQVYRVGFGSFTLFRLFPDWFYRILHLDGHLTRGLAFHALFMWAFMANGLLYFLFLAISGQWRNLVPNRLSLREMMGWRRRAGAVLTMRVASKYNPFQRVAYTLTNLMAVGSMVTGVAIWKPTSLHLITTLCGGYQNARWLHFWLTMGFCVFIGVHLIQVARSGWVNLRSMIIGAQIVSLERRAARGSKGTSAAVGGGDSDG